MRSFISVACLILIGCGGSGKVRNTDRVIEFDPELAEVCINEDSPLERVCEKEVDDFGRIRWSMPLSTSDEFKRVKKLLDADPEEPQLIPLLSKFISNAEHTNCSGPGCEKYVRNVGCEGQIARIYRAKAYYAQGKLANAFRDLAAVVHAGPEHAFYEQMPEFFTELEKKGFPKSMISVCLSVYEWPEKGKIKGRDRHWKPYTKDDPAPKW